MRLAALLAATAALISFQASAQVLGPTPFDSPIVEPLIGRAVSVRGTFCQGSVAGACVTGATLRTIESKLRDTVSATDFQGVDPTGSTDSASGIQAAIDSLATSGGNVYLPHGTYKIVTGLTIAAGISPARGLLCEAGAVLSYTGTGSAITVGTSAAETQRVSISGCGIDLGSAGSGANAINTVRVTDGALRDLSITGRTSAPDLGTGIILDGTNGYSASIKFERVVITGNYTKGIYCQGAAGVNTCNFHSFDLVTIARTTAKPGTGTIGFHYGANAGDGRLLSINVENYDTAYQIDGVFLRGEARAENNTKAIAFGAASVDSVISLTPFGNTTLVTYAGGQAYNSLILPDGFESNLNTGVINSYLTLRDRTDRSVTLRLQAGATAEQQRGIEFDDRTGSPLYLMAAKSYGALTIEDYASGNIPRLSIVGGTNDDTSLASAGTGAVTVNLAASRGTGGFKLGDGAGNTTAVISSAGKFTTYNSIATVGLGHPTEYGATVALTAQTANLAATNVYASAPAGEYRVCANARTTTSGTGTTANLNIIWTDEGGVKTDAVGTWALNSVTVTGQINKCEFIHAAAATAIQVSVTAGTYGTSVYAISAQVERLQ